MKRRKSLMPGRKARVRAPNSLHSRATQPNDEGRSPCSAADTSLFFFSCGTRPLIRNLCFRRTPSVLGTRPDGAGFLLFSPFSRHRWTHFQHRSAHPDLRVGTVHGSSYGRGGRSGGVIWVFTPGVCFLICVIGGGTAYVTGAARARFSNVSERYRNGARSSHDLWLQALGVSPGLNFVQGQGTLRA